MCRTEECVLLRGSHPFLMLTLSSFMPPPISQTEEAIIYISEEMPDSSLNQISPGFLRRMSGTFLSQPVLLPILLGLTPTLPPLLLLS